ncbi:MAG: hypothetical protein HYV76_02170 [Candidatus Vogelbacteria bacterium]|nr:hypothetical protein [Candidatus Vogelbacteria bacterium]
MIKQLKYHNVTWIDIQAPSKDELESIGKQYDLHSLVTQELTEPSIRSKVDLYENYIYVILHFSPTQEIDFVIGQDFLMTVHYEPIESLLEFSQIFETKATVEKARGQFHAGHLFYYITRGLYTSLENGLNEINRDLRSVEKRIFHGEEKAMVTTLANINRDLLDFRWALKAHKEILTSLEIAGVDFFNQKFGYYLRSLTGEYEKIWEGLNTNREVFDELKSTNESLLSIKTNETMKMLTVIAFIFLPVSLIGNIFGLSSSQLPFLDRPDGFFIVTGIMAVVALTMAVIAKANRWL